jgi:hypothetical protein
MISASQALEVAALTLLPGALFTWKLEQQTGPWGIGLSDQDAAVRWQLSHLPRHHRSADLVVVRARISPRTAAQPGGVPWLVWLVPLGYVGVPILTGAIVGSAAPGGENTGSASSSVRR